MKDKNNDVALAESYVESIRNCERLRKVELAGFVRGVHKGKKTEGVSVSQILESLLKQFHDCQEAMKFGDSDQKLKSLGDVRNVAAILFMKLIGEI